ncbi:MAG: outer-membrane lipoprotein carrier protein LolA [Bacteroidales bacterium]
MKRIAGISFTLLLFALSIAAQNATDILDKAASAYNASNGAVVSFVMHSRSEINHTAESFEGVINMKGGKFTLETPGMKTWYDGVTQWTYMKRSEEVNISTPEGDELQFTNPAVLLHSYKKGFTAVYMGEGTATNGKAAHIIELAPKKKKDIVRVELQIEKYSGLPARIHIEHKNGTSHTITISSLQTGINQPDNFFVFDEAQYPNAEIIDLR